MCFNNLLDLISVCSDALVDVLEALDTVDALDALEVHDALVVLEVHDALSV